MAEEEKKDDLVGNRLTVVPGIAVYSTKPGSSSYRGRIGVSASNITCTPKETETEPSFGTWSATGTRLEVLIGAKDYGPRSGLDSEYKDKLVGVGRQKMMVSREALLGVVEGKSAWGDSGEKAGRLLVWKWSFEDIDEIYVGRIKKMFKMWDAELMIKSHDPKATLHYSGYGEEAHVFGAYDAPAKAAKQDGSNLMGFARTLSRAVAQHRGCEVIHKSDGDPKEPGDVFTFS